MYAGGLAMPYLLQITKDEVDMHFDLMSNNGLKQKKSEARISIQRPVYTAADLQEVYQIQDDLHSFTKPWIYKTKAYCSFFNLWLQFLSFFPVLTWLPKYQFKKWFVKDLSAGLTLGIMQIPQGMAYGMLTTLPAIYGLYNSFVPVLVYFIFGSSKHLSMGTFAITSLMIGEAIEKSVAEIIPIYINGTIHPLFDEETDACRVQFAVTSSFIIGLVQIALGMLQSGFIAKYLSDPLVSGFTTGAAFHIFSSQAKHVVGMKIPRSKTGGVFGLFKLYIYIFSNIKSVNYGALIIGVVGAIIVYAIKYISQKYQSKIKFPLPAELVVVILGTGLSYGFNFNQKYDIPILKKVPKGLPPISYPNFELLDNVLLDSIIIGIVAFAVNVSVAKAFAKKNNYKIDPNQELYAYGATNVVASFFSCFVSAASLSRSLIQENLGVTQLAGIFSCGVVLLALTVLAPLFEPLPNAILASIVLVALKGLFKQFAVLGKLVKTSKIDALVWALSFVAVVCLGVDYGLGVGLLVNILITVYRSSRGKLSTLTQLKDSEIFFDENGNELTELPGIKIFKFQSPLFYANVESFQGALYEETVEPNNCEHIPVPAMYQYNSHRENKNFGQARVLSSATVMNKNFDQLSPVIPYRKQRSQSQPAPITNGSANILGKNLLDSSSNSSDSSSNIHSKDTFCPLHTVVVDCSKISYVDIMGVQILINTSKEFKNVEVDFFVVVSPGELLKSLEKGGFIESHGWDKIFPSIQDAVQYSLHKEHLRGVCKPQIKDKNTDVAFEIASTSSSANDEEVFTTK